MSSTLRNAVQRRNHKERSQPAERAKYGLLEKRKDYQLRSRDFNAKKAKKAALTRLAKERNPDEFYHAMTSARTRDGGVRVADRDTAKVLTPGEVMLLKTQDAGYLRVQRDRERRAIESLEGRLAFEAEGKHTVFVEEVEQARKFKPEEFFGTHEDLVDRRFNRPRIEQLAEGGFGEDVVKGGEDPEEAEARRRAEKRERSKLAKGREQAYKELEARMKREKDLKKLEREQEMQRARMVKGGNATINKHNKVRKR
ncbi:small-subunit processome [Tricharina praecox]|uniref:small-subunit processome n=1 Tax=Tricharina praecox TaxID=43433 RepID=UPI00221ED123|nr:small-subunit processome [Tricharina praecox]KAI5858788.1 small-subunit processome [Tricharina praecox]